MISKGVSESREQLYEKVFKIEDMSEVAGSSGEKNTWIVGVYCDYIIDQKNSTIDNVKWILKQKTIRFLKKFYYQNHTLKERIKYAWRILCKGYLEAEDMIELGDSEHIDNIIEALNECKKAIGEKK